MPIGLKLHFLFFFSHYEIRDIHTHLRVCVFFATLYLTVIMWLVMWIACWPINHLVHTYINGFAYYFGPYFPFASVGSLIYSIFCSAIHMGFRRSPPSFLSLTNKTNHQIFKGLKGVNFASGGSGILDSTVSITIGFRLVLWHLITLSRNYSHTKASDLFLMNVPGKHHYHDKADSIFLHDTIEYYDANCYWACLSFALKFHLPYQQWRQWHICLFYEK